MPGHHLNAKCSAVSYFTLNFIFQQAYGSPKWLQPTYNLETHLSPLIGDYSIRKRDGMNNLWILKPWNMARTIDTTVTDNLSAIIRLMETGPKICQKYIEHPALFQGKKFDLRYIVLVRSMKPLEIFVADTFWVCTISATLIVWCADIYTKANMSSYVADSWGKGEKRTTSVIYFCVWACCLSTTLSSSFQFFLFRWDWQITNTL